MKQSKARLSTLLLGVLFAIGLVGAFSSNTHAASVHDDDYITTDSLRIKANFCAPYDATLDWASYIKENSIYNTAGIEQSWANRSRWGVSLYYDTIYVYWTEDSSLYVDWESGMISGYTGNEFILAKGNNLHYATLNISPYNGFDCKPYVNYYGVDTTNSGVYLSWHTESDLSSKSNAWNFFIYTDYPNYPTGYEGPLIADVPTIDKDGDGLSMLQELEQGTSDSNSDTDGDGIDDLKESEWFADRDEVYCDTGTSPYVCAYPDPIVQDIYVEVDWMNDTSTSTLFKPSSTQLGLVTSMFADEGINLHFDTGEFGGGNELSPYTAALRQDSVATIPDFANYKNGGDSITSNFDSDRLGIWRYMIYGNFYSNTGGTSSSSGWAEVLGDDLFVSGGVVENVSGATDADRAVANTIAHELGHGLCLSDERVYFEQDEQCVFEGIDNNSGLPPINDPDAYYNLENYESVMNYRYQLTDQDDMGSVDYSHGPNSSTNHDDWSAVKALIRGFSGSHTLYVEFGARSARPTVDKPLSADGLVVAESIL